MTIRQNNPALDATKTPTMIDIAWSAGIYEGEGTCRLAGGTKRGFMVAVVQKDPEILFRLRDWFGGSVRTNGKDARCHVWDVCGDRARIFIGLVYPFLSARRKVQADSTNSLEFMFGQPTNGLSVDELKIQLESFYAEKKRHTWRGNPDIRRQRQLKLVSNS